MKKNNFLIGFVIILGILLSETNVQAVQAEIDCYGSLKAYADDPRMSNYTCSCPNGAQGMPVCKPKSSSGGYAPSGGLGPSQQMAVGIVGALFNNLFSDLFNDSTASSSADAQQEQLRIQQEEQRKKEQQAAMDAWNKALETAEQEALAKKQRDASRGSALVSDHGITGGGGTLEPMWITQKPEPKPIQSGGYPTSKLTQAQRLSCASYFLKRALEEEKNKNYEGVRFFNEQADKVMTTGARTDVECKFPQMPDFPTPKAQAAQQMEPEKFAALMNDFNVKIKKLQNIETELNKVRQEKQTAEENLKKIDEKITEIKNQVQSAQKPEEKTEMDDLLNRALAARSDSENQLNTAEQRHQELTNEAKDMAKDIDAKLKLIQQQRE